MIRAEVAGDVQGQGPEGVVLVQDLDDDAHVHDHDLKGVPGLVMGSGHVPKSLGVDYVHALVPDVQGTQLLSLKVGALCT